MENELIDYYKKEQLYNDWIHGYTTKERESEEIGDLCFTLFFVFFFALIGSSMLLMIFPNAITLCFFIIITIGFGTFVYQVKTKGLMKRG